MQKSKIATICFLIIIVIYTTLRVVFFQSLGAVYTYIINPLFWIICALILYKLLGKNYENKKLRKEIIEYVLIACLIYILVYMIAGLFVTFGKNPYSRTIKGILLNIWSMGSVIVAREYVRYRLINNVYNKDKKVITIIVTILFTLIDYNIWKKIGEQNISFYYIFSELFQEFIPALSLNILYSYLAVNNNYIASIIYELITNLYLWITPILPHAPWIMYSFIDTVIPMILLLYIRYSKNKLDKFKSREKILNSDPRNMIPLMITIILVLWFALGIFPIKPVAIASGSMEDILYIGDVVLIKKCKGNDVNVGDIIEYQMDGYTVIHRIIEKYQTKGRFYFRTKGDNNSQPDTNMVTEDQIIGKVIYKIRYLGYPSIWFDLLKQQQEPEVEVEI